ncbi:hypothetical protein OAJ30_01050 [Alphaproteobacteria bacterium]|nr:hypothetical protein [Alphaproteobacteria bacterium]
MAIRKSIKEDIFLSKDINNSIELCENALNAGNFTNINKNTTINQLTADYKKFSVWGEITISLLPNDQGTNIAIECMANIDNAFALFKSPGKTILRKFKDNLK